VSDRRRSLIILVAVLALIAGSVWVLATKPTRLGLDLQGGVQLVYEANPTPQVPEITPEALERSLDIMRERVDQFGVAEPELLISGNNQLELNLPGVDDPERVAEQVGSTAQMFFYDWEPNVLDEDCETNPELVNGGERPITGLYNAVKRASKCTEADLDPGPRQRPSVYVFDEISQRLLAGGPGQSDRAELLEDIDSELRDRVEVLEVPAGAVVVRDEKGNVPPGAPKPDRWWVIRDKPVLSGTDITNPEQSFDQGVGNEPIVTMEFTDEGRRAFQRTTQAIAERGLDNAALNGGLTDPIAASHHFAIRLDDELISTPYINFRENPEGIDGSNGASISGGFTIQSAQDLARLLKVGALPVELDLISRSFVSATLGRQALDQGLLAGLAGFGIVALFLVGFYRVLGVIATVALGVYALYLYALIELIPVTMTLPGIAGLILTIGVAADANIVIFERVKEEIRAGRSIPVGIVNGYRKGFSTIVDANVVTLLVAFILFVLATAGVKGFALMLGLGTIVSLFTAVLATQAILLALRGSAVLRTRSALGAGDRHKRWTFDFMGASRWFFSVSGLILLVGALAIAGKGINFGIDFESGARYTASLEQPATVEQVRDTLEPIGLADAEIQTVRNPDLGANVVQISTEQAGQTDRVNEALESAFGLTGDVTGSEIGPTFGATVAEAALIAIIASLLVIGVYLTLRFEWKFAVPVLIALSHDILITAGVYALVGREVTTSTVAALLTILGFSLYDTIIVFDRIRENAPRMPSASFAQIMNRSLSEVLTRSLATSFCTLLPVLTLLLFGGDTLKDFAFALLVGIASGTYSSIFIAAPVLTHWKEREPVYRARLKRIQNELGHIPAYAVPVGDAPVDVAPAPKRPVSRTPVPAGAPCEVSQAEFDEMVRNLGVDAPASADRAVGARPAGGRRARGRGPAAPGDTDGDGGGRPRNRRPEGER
jgi:SecD/SecF fusion protein